MNANSRRTHRMASLLRSEIAQLLIGEVSDPRLKAVSITEVELTRDLKTARVFFAYREGNLKEIQRGLERAIPFFRRRLGDNLALKYVPLLDFIADTHADSVNRLLHLIEDTHRSPEEEGGESASAAPPSDEDRKNGLS